jgi:hypothetical protein
MMKVARTERPRRWRRELVIDHSGRRFTLRAKSAFRREFQLLNGPVQIGFISPEGLFTRRADAEFPNYFPLFLQVFIIWLVMMLWKQEDSAVC